MATDAEMVEFGCMHGQKLLSRSGRFDSWTFVLSASDWNMRTFDLVIRSLGHDIVVAKFELLDRLADWNGSG